ncbi:MAG: hypothetical protein ACP5GH_07260 [Nitrososphaeria archaeon]
MSRVTYVGPVMLNTLVEGRRGIEVRLENERLEDRKDRLSISGDELERALKTLKEKGWHVLFENQAFSKSQESPKSQAPDLSGYLVNFSDSESNINRTLFPRCSCSLAVHRKYKKEAEDADPLLRLIVYHECNSISEIYNKRTIFLIPFIEKELNVNNLLHMRDNELRMPDNESEHKENQEEGPTITVTAVVGLEFEDVRDGLLLNSASMTVILAPKGWSRLNSKEEKSEGGENYPAFSKDEEKLTYMINSLFHIRKTFLSRDQFEGFLNETLEALSELLSAIEGDGHVNKIDTEVFKPLIENGPHDLHDLQIMTLLGLFRAFYKLNDNKVFDDKKLKELYSSMRDDVRSNTFTSIVMTTYPALSDSSVVTLLEGFPVRLSSYDQEKHRTLQKYRIGYEDLDTNFYISWNDLLMLRTTSPQYGKSFIKNMVPRALIVNLMAGLFMYLNSTYTELLERLRNPETYSEVREIAREMYMETALLFDLGYVQVPLLRKILERIVEDYGFKETLQGLRATLSSMDASVSAEMSETLNKVILWASAIVGLMTMGLMMAEALLPGRWEVWLLFPAAAVLGLFGVGRRYDFFKKCKGMCDFFRRRGRRD